MASGGHGCVKSRCEPENGLPSVKSVIGELESELNEGIGVKGLLLSERLAKRREGGCCYLQIRCLTENQAEAVTNPRKATLRAQRESNRYLH